MNLNTAQFMQLYAWYSWPNVVLCFLGGFLIDRVFGIRCDREPGCSGFVLIPYLALLQWKKWNFLFECRLDWALLRILVSVGLEPSSFPYLSVLDRLVCVKLLMWNCHLKFFFFFLLLFNHVLFWNIFTGNICSWSMGQSFLANGSRTLCIWVKIFSFSESILVTKSLNVVFHTSSKSNIFFSFIQLIN